MEGGNGHYFKREEHQVKLEMKEGREHVPFQEGKSTMTKQETKKKGSKRIFS
jgi:hypothetical protein